MGHAGVARRFHCCDGCKHRHRWLAHGEHVHIALQVAEHVGDRVDIVFEVKRAGAGRHIARILPVGDVDVVVGQEGFDGAAQQRRVMSRHGGDQQQLRVIECLAGRGRRARKVDQLAEWTLPGDLFGDRQALAVHQCRGDVENRLVVAARRAFKHFAGGGRTAADRGMGQRIKGMLEEHPVAVCGGARRFHGGMSSNVPVIEQGGTPMCPRRARD